MKKIILLSLTIVFSNLVFSQKSERLSNKFTVDITGGMTFKGYIFSGAFSLHNSYDSQKYLRAALEYYSITIHGKNIENFNRDINFPITSYNLNLTYNRTLFQVPGKNRILNISSYFSLDLGLGASIGYEVVNNSKYTLDTGEKILDKSEFVLGAIGRAEAEFYLKTRPFTFFCSVEQKYLPKSEIGKYRTSTNIGIRYWF